MSINLCKKIFRFVQNYAKAYLFASKTYYKSNTINYTDLKQLLAFVGHSSEKLGVMKILEKIAFLIRNPFYCLKTTQIKN